MRNWIANLKKWDGRNYYINRFNAYDEVFIIFDCHTCGDPTAGSYIGPIMSNMCWECNNKHTETWTNINRR